MYKFTTVRWHVWQHLRPSIRRNETIPPQKNKKNNNQHPLKKLISMTNKTHSANAFSTSPTNLGPNVLADPTNSTDQVTLPLASRFSSLIPSASASLALRFLISHSPVHVSASFVPEQGTVERRFPHGHVSVTGVRQGSVSGQAAGAWQVCVQGWWAGRLERAV